MIPTIEVLRDLGGEASVEDINAGVARNVRISSEYLKIIHAGEHRQTELAYRAAWARTYLKHRGLLINCAARRWKLTEKGAAATPDVLRSLVASSPKS